MKKYWIGLAILLLLAAFYLFSTYNRLVTLNEGADSQWAQVETQYQRRFDLIPNVVSTVKGFAKQEQSVFGEIAEARTKYSGASTINDKVNAANQVESSLGRLLVIAENYPDLKSSQLFSNLNIELEGSENRISVERKRYNDTVQSYNLLVKSVPSSWIASRSGFIERSYFKSISAAQNAPTVQF